MKFEPTTILLAFAGIAAARPALKAPAEFRGTLRGREVPQEHSHDQFLTTVRTFLFKNNPMNIKDPVFGLLGNAAAAAGLGQFTDTECLQRATADQAFSNAKVANDIPGMTAALIYSTLERNTAKVGLASNSCTSYTAVNPEIAALSQHQDPASPNAAAINKAIVLKLAVQIKSVKGDPQDALKSGTFTPGNPDDPTSKGNSCDDPDCIFKNNLLVQDATPDEINAAVSGTTPNPDTNVAGNPVNTTTPTPTPNKACRQKVSPTPTPVQNPDPGSKVANVKLNFGDCPNPSILFGQFPGQAQESFEAADSSHFSHGPALNIGVIANFICTQLNSPCKADQTAIDVCKNAADTASKLTGQAAADSFNNALGLSSPTTTSNPQSTTDTNSQPSAPATGTSSGTPQGSVNVQTFTGSLGGLPPPVIFTAGSDRPFAVNGSTFLNKGAAIGRSCDIQHNACANAANSGQLSGGVGQCDAQTTACKDAGL